ncbi:MAG: nicotinamide riboside transporter PnuC [Saprospiraceae bacterium]|nr:MAG: nicotinamide riboside transporter PnuC [Saprospiraceae bacterium]
MEHFLSLIAEQIQTQTWLDGAITVTALIYVWLAAKEKVWCWAWGIVSCSLWAWADFARYNLWVDGILQIFYVGMGAWGLYAWRFGGAGKKELSIRRLPWSSHLRILAAGAVLTLLLGLVFDRYTPTSLPYPDAFITAFSILSTFLTVRKVLENWLYWIAIDALAILLFAARDAVLIAFVMAVYAIIAIFGFITWRRRFAAQSEQ